MPKNRKQPQRHHNLSRPPWPESRKYRTTSGRRRRLRDGSGRPFGRVEGAYSLNENLTAALRLAEAYRARQCAAGDAADRAPEGVAASDAVSWLAICAEGKTSGRVRSAR